MAQLTLHCNHTKKAPFFDGTNYAYWKVKMKAHLKQINREVWKVTETKFEVAKPDEPTPVEERKLQANDIAIGAFHEALADKVFEQVKNMEVSHDVWKKLEESYEGTEGIKTAKAFILQQKFASFEMKEDESVPEMFHRLESIVNELNALGEEVKDSTFSNKFLRCLPERFENLTSLLVRTTLKTSTPQQVLAEVMTDDAYRDDKKKPELEKKKKKEEGKDEKDKSVAFMSSTSTSSNGKLIVIDPDNDEQMAFFVKRFGSFMKKKGYKARRGKKASSSKKHQNKENFKCFRCHSTEHLIAKCPYEEGDEDAIEKEKKRQKKKKAKKEEKKKNEAHVASWDSDTSSSSSEDESSSDEEQDKKSKKKKHHANLALSKKISLFDQPSACFMAKSNKVQSDSDDGDSDSDASVWASDDEETDLSKKELESMLKDSIKEFMKSREECKGLKEERNSLQQELDELRASHESQEDDHEKLKKAFAKLEKAHAKLEKAHNKLVEAHSSLQEENKSMALKSINPPSKSTCDIGLTCDIMDELSFKPIVVAPTNSSCSTTMSISTSDVDSTCEATLIVENDNLKKEVQKLNHSLAKAYGGEDRLLMCLGSQRASLYKEGLGYTPKKGKAAFAPHKTSFVRNNGSYCKNCKQVGHDEHRCTKKKNNVSTIKINASYMLVKKSNGVKAKFIGAPWMGSKKKAIWVPKTLVSNLQGPKQVWVPKRN